MILPNLVIGGAPKCGTSTVFRWLIDHPDVCGASVKETFYLMDRDHPLLRRDSNIHSDGLEGYARFFDACAAAKPDARVHVEATTHYLYSEFARKTLATLPTQPRVLFLLRRPSARVYSSFRYTRENLARLDPSLTFREFVRLSQERPEDLGRFIRPGPSAYVLPRDLGYSRYVDHLRDWFRQLGADRVRVVLLEELTRDPARVMSSLSEWIGVAPAFYSSYAFPRANETVAIGAKGVHRVARGLGSRIPDGRLKTLAKRAYFAAQRWRAGGRPPSEGDDGAVLRELDRYYRESDEALSREFGIDVVPWLHPPSSRSAR